MVCGMASSTTRGTGMMRGALTECKGEGRSKPTPTSLGGTIGTIDAGVLVDM